MLKYQVLSGSGVLVGRGRVDFDSYVACNINEPTSTMELQKVKIYIGNKER